LARFYQFVSTLHKAYADPHRQCFVKEFLFVAKVAIIHRKIKKKWAIISGKVYPNLAINQTWNTNN
jgi:hypothetical protein